MIVKDLIIELLDCNLEADVSIEIVTEEQSIDTEDIYIDESSFGNRDYVSLKHDPADVAIIEKGELQALKERIEELEDERNE